MSSTYPKAQEQLHSCNQPGEWHWFSLTPPIHAQAQTGSIITCFTSKWGPSSLYNTAFLLSDTAQSLICTLWLPLTWGQPSLFNQKSMPNIWRTDLHTLRHWINQVWATAKTSTQERQLESCKRLSTKVMLTFPGYIKPSNIKGHNKLTTPAPK